MSKREREENQIAEAVRELEAALERTPDLKIKALQKVQSIIDPTDEQYDVQIGLANEGVVQAVVALLDDESSSVAAAAAETVVSLAQHSSTVLVRLKHGVEMGFAEGPEKVNLNTSLQTSFVDAGVIRPLVKLLFGSAEEAVASAGDALTALTSYNHSAKLAYLLELVHILVGGDTQVLEALDSVVGGMDVKDDVAVVLDQALLPLVRLVGGGSAPDRVAACTLLATIVEKRPAVAEFLRAEGALPPIVQLLLGGGLAAGDVAAHTLWLLIRGNKRVLRQEEDALGVEGAQLVAPLLELIKAGDKKYEREAAEAAGGGEAGEGGEEEVEWEDDAMLLLRALAAHQAEVKARVAGTAASSSCAIQ